MDILFIMRRICFCTKSKGGQGGAQTECDTENAVDEEEVAAAPAAELLPSGTSTSTPLPKGGRGRGGARKRDMGEEPVRS